MPAGLTGQFICDAYTTILHLSTNNLEATQATVYDGAGNASSLSIATSGNGATISGILSAQALKAGGLTYPVVDGSASDVLTTDGAGNLSWTAKTPVSASVLSSLMELLWPVGEIYITRRSCAPDIWLGFGAWELYGKGKTLVGIDPDDTTGVDRFDTLDNTGGSKRVTLSAVNMPRHRHNLVGDAGGQYYVTNSKKSAPTDSGGINFESGEGFDYGGEAQAYPYTGYEGSDESHQNLQPYIVVYFWKRIG